MSTAAVPTGLQRLPYSAGWKSILSAMKKDGGVIIKGFASPEQAAKIQQDIRPALDSLDSGSKNGDEFSKEFHGKQTKRLTNLVTLSPAFVDAVLENELLHQISTNVFAKDSGDYWLNTAQAIEIGPGNKSQPLHRDQMQYPVFTTLGPNSPEATINFFLALSEFTEEMGATRIIPGSHLWHEFRVDEGSPEDTVPAEMEPGDVCLFSGKVIHGGGANVTENKKRLGVAVSIQCSYLTPEEAYPFIIDMDRVKQLSPRVQKLIGFRSQYPLNSPGLWQSDYRELADVLGLA